MTLSASGVVATVLSEYNRVRLPPTATANSVTIVASLENMAQLHRNPHCSELWPSMCCEVMFISRIWLSINIIVIYSSLNYGGVVT